MKVNADGMDASYTLHVNRGARALRLHVQSVMRGCSGKAYLSLLALKHPV